MWLEHATEAFLPVQCVAQKGDKVIAKSASGEEFEIDAKVDLPEVSPSSLKPLDNMVGLEDLSEGAILHNLRARFEEDKIYTYIASILVSVNPFKQLPIYSPTIMQQYRDKLARREAVAPHVYALADGAFRSLVAERMNQSVIISGESGAGKTEATKLVLQYMAEMSGQGSDVEQQLLKANPIIEAFGNAKTVRNNNSSRFGKWVEINFNDKFHIIGAKIHNYLLEKSRIVGQGLGERNYHFYYQMCAGAPAELRNQLRLGSADDFKILNGGRCPTIDGVDDAEDFAEVVSALQVLEFSKQEQQEIFRTTAAVLHLGNVRFVEDGVDKARVENMDALNVVADLLGCELKTLEGALVSQRKQMGKESILTVLDKKMAENNRDALLKNVYGNMFNWIILRINKTLTSKQAASKLVGVLDIFGFEIFESNSFEQFCINFTNEKMQQHFNEQIFTMEQEEYKSDQIDVAHVGFIDNQPVLDLAEKGRQSILGMLDEELRIPKGSDLNLLSRLNQTFAKHPCYQYPKTAKPIFTVVHYAGAVTYDIEGFLEKNKDSLGEDVARAVRGSKSSFVAGLVPETPAAGVTTLGAQFKAQLQSLMDTIKKTQPHFIRCIKSNNLKVSETFDSQMVLRQLRYLGLKEVVRIRQLGYPVRRFHGDFLARYKVLCPDLDVKDSRVQCQRVLERASGAGVDAKDWRVGKTKVFIRNHVQPILDQERDKAVRNKVIKIQAIVRARLANIRVKRMKSAEKELMSALAGTDPKALDASLANYESLMKFRAKPQLVQQAIKRRNLLVAQQNAQRGLVSAAESKDVSLIQAAIKGAEDAQLTDAYAPLAEAKRLLVQLVQYKKDLEQALASRDVSLLERVLQTAAQLGLKGTQEIQAKAFYEQVKEEEAVKKRLADAMNSRDLAALKHALQVAMQNKSGAMVGSALQRAVAAGLAEDPVVKAALAMEATLEKEVSVYKMAAELQAAISSGDLAILESTVKMAQSKNFSTHALYKQACDMIEKLGRKKVLLSDLSSAISQKNMPQLQAAMAAVAKEGLQDTNEYQEANRLTEQLKALESQLQSANKDMDTESLVTAVAAAVAMGVDQKKMEAAQRVRDSLVMNRDVQQALQTAVKSRDVNMLRAAIQRAKAANNADMPLAIQAKEILDELEEEAAAMKNEEDAADAAVAAASATPEENAAAEAKKVEFDVKVYSSPTYEFVKFHDLRSANNYAQGKLFGKEQSKQKMFRFIKSVIPNSLTKLNDDPRLCEMALDLFKSIQGFMLDRAYSFPDSLVPTIVETAITTAVLRNEVYAQLMKQLSQNPRPEGVLRGWMLMALCAEFVPPSQSFLNFVLHFCHEHLAFTDHPQCKSVQGYASYTIFQLERTVHRFLQLEAVQTPLQVTELKAGTEAKGYHKPVVEHVTSFRERTMESKDVVVSFSDGSQATLFVQPWQTNTQIVPALAATVGIKDLSGLGIFELNNQDGNSTYLTENENLLDFQHQWAKKEVKVEQAKSGGFFSKLFGGGKKEEKKAVAEGPSRRFVLRRRLYPQPVGSSPDRVAQSIMFHDFLRTFADGYHYMTTETAALIAAMAKRVVEKGLAAPVTATPSQPPLPSPKPWEVLPPNFQHGKHKISEKDFVKKVKESEARPEVASVTIESFLELVKKLPSFGCLFFHVKQSQESRYPKELVIGINSYGLSLFDVASKAEIEHFPLVSIMAWSSTPILFLFKVGRQNQGGKTTDTLRFEVPHARMGKEMCDLLLAYANELLKVIKAQAAAKK